MKIRTIMFDLDGTLSESGLGIHNSIKYALEKWGYPSLNQAQLDSCIGPPLDESFIRLLGVDAQKAWDLVRTFREYYESQGIYQTRAYHGVSELLERLKDDGCTLMICTGKPQHSAKKVLEILNIDSYFSDLIGTLPDGTYSDKAEAMKVLIERNSGLAPFAMVGDRFHDIVAAKANSVPAIGVLWGYGTEQELLEHGADYIAKDAEQLYSYIKSL